jgi:sulfur-carrier protein adenylyltransferase/sulfurtransferase
VISELSPREVDRRRREAKPPLVLDVRDAWELAIASLPDTVNIPMAEVPARINELDREAEVIVMCRSGGRSRQVANYLAAQGFPRVYNLEGGILAWGRDLDPALSSY